MADRIRLFHVTMHEEARERALRVLSPLPDGSLYVGQGPVVDEFERRFADYIGVDPRLVVSTSSCTAAMTLAMMVIGVRYTDEVVTSPMNCTAGTSVIARTSAQPIWADISPRTGNIEALDAGRKITHRTAAIMAVNWGGRRAITDELHQLGVRHRIPLIEDAAHGPYVRTAPIADYVAYSFGPIKQLCAVDGGALVCADEEAAAEARLLRWYGLDRTSKASFRCEQDIMKVGDKLHMNDLNAAIALGNLPYLDATLARTRENARYYDARLRYQRQVTIPPYDPSCSYWFYTILVERRADFMAHMDQHGIDVSPVHARNDFHTAFYHAFPDDPLPGVDYFDKHQVAIPCGAWLTDEDRERVLEAVLAWQ